MSEPESTQHSSPDGLPAAIYIIRHGEKPPDASEDDSDDASTSSASSGQGPFGVELDGNQDSHSLIPQGWQRAGGLAQLFDPSDGVFTTSALAQPTTIASPKYGDPPKHRTYQTVWPLAQKLGIDPSVEFEVGKEKDLVSWLLAQAGETVLICWEHKHIIDITSALADVIAGGDVPGPWPSDRFDIVVALTPDPAAAGAYNCVQVPELLLAGDSINPIPG